MTFENIFKLNKSLSSIEYCGKKYELKIKKVFNEKTSIQNPYYHYDVFIRNKVKKKKKLMCFVSIPISKYKKPLFTGENGYVGTITKKIETQDDFVLEIKNLIWDLYFQYKMEKL